MKPGTDYSATAIHLTNSAEVGILLQALGTADKQLHDCEVAYFLATRDLPEHIAQTKAIADAAKARKAIHEAIDRYGSYQDIENGIYAVKQARKSISYDPNKCREYLGPYGEAVIQEAVSIDAIKGLLKGKLITEEKAKLCEIVTPMSPAYIIEIIPIEREDTNADKGTD